MAKDSRESIGRARYVSPEERDFMARTADAWERLKASIPVGQIISGKVIAEEPFGFFVDVEQPFLGLLEVVNIPQKSKSDTSHYPHVGDTIEAVVIHYRETNRQICLSTHELPRPQQR